MSLDLIGSFTERRNTTKYDPEVSQPTFHNGQYWSTLGMDISIDSATSSELARPVMSANSSQ